MSQKPIGILGGMGPGAGVYFKQLIVDLTPATSDQEHISTILYTNPRIPDRSTAILQDNTAGFVTEICASLKKLDQFGVAEIFIPCNTSFIGYPKYQASVTAPIYHMPNQTRAALQTSGVSTALLLATNGTYISGVYQDSDSGTSVTTPTHSQRQLVHAFIMSIKSGNHEEQEQLFWQVVELVPDTAESVILGCTELSMFASKFRTARPDVYFADPLEIASQYIIRRYMSVRTSVT